MTTPRFYSSQLLPRSSTDSASFEVSEEIARHLLVLRMAPGDNIVLFDGQGGEWVATITVIGKRQATVQLINRDPVERESPLDITLVQSLASSDKMDFIVQKAVELGVTAIQPVSSERATLKLTGDRLQKRTAHWQAVAQAACEQCGRNRVPPVAEPMSLEGWVTAPTRRLQLMLSPEAGSNLIEAAHAMSAIALLIGPEGGFSDSEVALAAKHGVVTVKLGPRILRTETAGLAAIAALNGAFGDLR